MRSIIFGGVLKIFFLEWTRTHALLEKKDLENNARPVARPIAEEPGSIKSNKKYGDDDEPSKGKSNSLIKRPYWILTR